MAKLTYKRTCSKCGGTGDYNLHGAPGVCFQCGGDGFVAGLLKAAKQMATEIEIAGLGDLIITGHKSTEALGRIICIKPCKAPEKCGCLDFCFCAMEGDYEMLIAEESNGGKLSYEKRRRQGKASKIKALYLHRDLDDDTGSFYEA